MRIAIFSDNFYPEISGISDSIIRLAVELAKFNHQACFFAPKYSRENYRFVKQPATELKLGNNIKIKRFCSLPFPSPTKQARLVLPSFWRWLSVKNFKPDIIHSQLFFGVGLEGLAAAKFLRCPIIGTNHTRIKEFFKTGILNQRWLENIFARYMNWYYNRCDYVTAPARSFLDEMIKGGITAPSRAISNPVDMDVFNNLDRIGLEAVRKKYNLSKPAVVYAGRLAYEKSIDVLIRAIKIVKQNFPEVNLALAGQGQAEESLRKLTAELGLEDNVKFLGTLNHHDLAELYRSADVFAIASTSEVQSMTIIQAMACGLPAVGVNSNSIPELIQPETGLLFKPGDSQDLAEKIIMLMSDLTLRKKLSQGAINFAPKFSAVSIAKEWIKLYKEVIKEYNK
jgi:1,2-diacylglycerol 3-alpha-glucosyltransferase